MEEIIIKNESYRVLNLEGAYIVKRIQNEKTKVMETKLTYDIDMTRVNKIYTCTMPYSLEIYRALEIVENETWKDGNDNFTNLFVNLKFTRDFFVQEDVIVKDEEGNTVMNEDGTEVTKKVKFEIKKKDLRKLLYTTEFLIDNIPYRFFKRGASKARNANVIFIKKDFYEQIYVPCLLGLKFEEGKEYDVTSREAYASLIMSNIIGVLNIPRESILIIKDLQSPVFKAKQTLTVKDDKGVHQQISEHKDGYDVSNNMTDGEGLMCEELYINNEILQDATCALLRNDFTKVNCCRTKLQDYYKEEFKENYDAAMTYDAWGRPKLASKVKLVITPSACKYLKFKEQYDEDDMACYDDWLSKIPEMFGIVKVDHIGNYNYDNRLSYQMINSMNLTYNEMKFLMKDEFEHIKCFKDNTLVDSDALRKMSSKNKKINRAERNKMTYFLERIKGSEEGSTGEMITDLLKVNSDFRFTEKFKNWKSKQLQDYVENMRLGKIRIKNSIYAIVISCPYEFLVATTKVDNKVDSCIMTGWEVYCPRFGEEDLILIRNPQINAGNISHVTNKYHEEYKYFGLHKNNKPVHDFVVFANTYDVDLMNRAQGMDFDIDSVYLSNNKCLTRKAKDSQEWITPVNGIKGKNTKIKNTMEALADLDNYLGGSTMTIGKIVNKSAIFNAYMYDAINKKLPQEYIDACYNASSICSSFSQIAIDMAKKSFKGLSLGGELSKLNKTTYKNIESNKDEMVLEFKIDKENINTITIKDYIKDYIKLNSDDDYKSKYELIEGIENLNYFLTEYNKLDNKKLTKEERTNINEILDVEVKAHVEKMVVPYFFKYTAENNDYRIPTRMKCSMDYLEEIIDEINLKAIATDKVKIEDLFQMQKELTGTNFNTDKVDKVRMIISDCQTQLNKNCYKPTDNKDDAKKKKNLRRWLKNSAITEIKALKLNPKTVHRIIMRAFNADVKYKGFKILKYNDKHELITYIDYDLGEEYIVEYKELSEMTMTVLNLIYNSYREDFLNCFKYLM